VGSILSGNGNDFCYETKGKRKEGRAAATMVAAAAAFAYWIRTTI